MQKKSRIWQAVVLILATAACVCVAPVGAVGVIASPIMFENPHNLEDPIAWAAFMLMIGLWIVCLLGPLGAWVNFAKRQESRQWAAIGIPFAWMLALGLAVHFAPK